MGSLCFTWAGGVTHCHTAAWQDQTQTRTVPPFVNQERKPACTEAEELGSSLLTMPTAHSATIRPSLYSTPSWALGIILVIQAVKPARKGSSEILMSLNSKNQKHSFTVRLVGVRGLGLSWKKLWRIQVPLHIGGGQMTNTSRGTSPTNGSLSLWVRMWAAQERKIQTLVAQELHWGHVKGRKQPDFRAAGSHSTAADISDKHRGQKGKKRKGKNTIQKPQMDKLLQGATALTVTKGNSVSKRLLVQSFPITVILNISWAWLCCKFQRSLLQAAVLTWMDAQELQQGARGPAHSKCRLCPPSLQAQTTWAWHESFWGGFQFLSVPTGKT